MKVVPDTRGLLAGGLLAFSAALALGLPPEVFPESGPVIALCLAAGLFFVARGARLGAVLAGVGLALFQLKVSLAPGASFELLFSFVLGAGAFVLARALPTGRARRLPLIALAAIGPVLGLLACAQWAGLLAEDAAVARRLGLTTEIILRLEHGRPFGTQVVPAALAGALLISAAALGALGGPRRRWWVIPAGLLLAGFVLTASLGGFLGLLAGAGVLVAPRVRRWSVRRVLTLAAIAFLFAGALVVLRPVSVFELSRPDNPLRLRLGNWRGAVLVALEGPVGGTGLGSYASLYPAHRREGDSETRYAHNSWLQLGAEGGILGWALLMAAAAALYRRRHERDPELRWALAGTVAFAAHNLVDFTAYLPGVFIPALLLAGVVFAHDESQTPPRAERVATIVLALLVALAALPWAGVAVARRALDRATARGVEGEPVLAAGEALTALAATPWSTPRGVEAGGVLITALTEQGGDRVLAGATEAFTYRLVEQDPSSPAPWHLLGRWQLLRRAPAAAWRALEMAAIRHRAGRTVRETVAQIEDALRRGGFLSAPLVYGDEGSPRAPPAPWQSWDDLLFALALALAGLVVLRWLRPGSAPAQAIALALVLVLSTFGEGGALPGVRFGRALLIALALIVALFPRRAAVPLSPGADPSFSASDAWPREALLALSPALIWAGLSLYWAPASHAARDGFAALLGALVLLTLSMMLARRLDAWPRLVAALLALAGVVQASLWLAQRTGAFLAFDMSRVVVPLRVANLVRPAADFLHPGHLGTFLIAGGLASLGLALHAGRGWHWGVTGSVLMAIGLAGGGRASLLAFGAGGVVLGFSLEGRRARRLVALLVIVGLLLGASAVAWRFAHGDPAKWTRLRIWAACAAALGERPAFGFGPGGFAPLAGSYHFEDPSEISRFGRGFEGPHSDLLGSFLALGIPGGLLLLGGLTGLCGRGIRALSGGHVNERSRAAYAACAAALAAFVAHALVDDLFAERPAAWVAAALLAGCLAAAGPALGVVRPLRRPWRLAIVAALLVVLSGAEALPWAADRAYRAGNAPLAARLEPANARYQIALARSVTGSPSHRLALALDRTQRAIAARPFAAGVWAERAALLTAACHGPLPEMDTCQAAELAWSAALARSPRNVLLRVALARLHRSLGRAAAAEDDLRLALVIEPNDLGARLELIELLADEGAIAQARRQWDVFMQRAKGLALAHPISARDRALVRFSPAVLARMRTLFGEGPARDPAGALDGPGAVEAER